MKDDLGDLLDTWRPVPPRPAGFRRNVWRRIEAAQAQQAGAWGWRRYLTVWTRPAVALPALAAAIVLGFWFGTHAAATGPQQYVRWADPYARLAERSP